MVPARYPTLEEYILARIEMLYIQAIRSQKGRPCKGLSSATTAI